MPANAADLTFTLAMDEPVVVAGTPRIAIDVGGIPRYATYAAGTGTSSLTFSYAVQAGDFDANGITLASPLDLNGGNITDIAGNPVSALTFTPPDTSALKVQSYTTSFTTSPITNANANDVSFTISKLPAGGGTSYSYMISGANGGSVSAGPIGITGSSASVSGLDLSSFPPGEITLSVTITGPSGIGQAVIAKTTPSFTGALDSLPAAAAAYSTRRLRSAYAGPLIRVRRSTDDATQDIGAGIAGNLQAAALVSFCGTATCHVATWYDQSGNGRDATQASAAQPVLVTAGATELLGGRAAVRFASALSMAAPAALASSNEFTLSLTSAEQFRRSNFTWRLLEATGNAPRVLAAMPWNDGATYFDLGSIFSPNRIYATWPVPVGTPSVASFQNSASANTRGIYLNGGLFLSGNGFAAASDTLRFGENFDGHISELILFPSAITSSDRLALERSQGSYFGIPVP